MSLSALVSFKSRFVTYLLNFPRIYVVSRAGRSVHWLFNQWTDLPARDTTYTHKNDMLPHHRNI